MAQEQDMAARAIDRPAAAAAQDQAVTFAAPQDAGKAQPAEAATRVLAPKTSLGVDIVEIARMEQIINRTLGFTSRVFSPAERAYCEGSRKPAVHYATHFAAKEAVLKALGTGFSEGIGFTDVEVAHDEKGRPLAVLHGKAKEIADEKGINEIALSLSRTHDTAVANAIALTSDSRPKQEEKPSAREELAARFKELRSMLDELEEQIPEPLDVQHAAPSTEPADE